MKLAFISAQNVRHLVPSWAIDPHVLAKDMDNMLKRYFCGRKVPKWDSMLPFWIDYSFDGKGFVGRVAEPTCDEERYFKGMLCIDFGHRAIIVPLNELMKGAPSLEGTHCVYFHTIETETPLSYVGVTKQKWFSRWSQHESSARTGSPLLFHRALREHEGKRIVHRVFLAALDYDSAMGIEEEFVDLVGLYPKGLNMIPGGFAGIRYLGSLGVTARSAEDRDTAVESLSRLETISGRPNPLCAARWAADQDFVNRVVCGHSGRLSIDQVRAIRMLAAGGRDPEGIAEVIGDAVDRVKNVLSGKRYARAA